MKKHLTTTNFLMILSFIATPSLTKAIPVKQVNNVDKQPNTLCQELLQKVYPRKADQLAYAAGYDGTLPKNWDAYNEAQRIGCEWVSQRKPGTPCVDYWINGCRGNKPTNIPVIFSPRE